MKIQTPSILRLGWVLGVALVVAVGASALPAPAEAGGKTLSERQGASGTTLSETVTATAHWTKRFNWGITKTVNPATLDLFTGDSSTVTYTVTVTKDAGTTRAWIEGQVCITNGGGVATVGLTSRITVTMPPSTTGIASMMLDVSAKPNLGPGETYCYPYSVEIPSGSVSGGSSYKVTAATTITNHSGRLNTPFGPSASASTTMPLTATIVHDSVTVSDLQAPGGSLGTFSMSGTATYSHTFSCDADEGSHTNTASITYVDDNTSGPSATATVTVTCHASGSGGCTHTIGYWKNHPSAITPLLPIWLGTGGGTKSVEVTTSGQAVIIEQIPNPSNGIDKLYAQLLAAKLSIQSGADPSAVGSTITDADNFLANHNSGDWASLSDADQTQVLAWATALDNYNNGVTGPGHCGET